MKRLPPLVALLVVALCVVASGAAKERPKSKAQLAREAKAAEKAIKNLKVPEGWLVPSEDMKVGAKGDIHWYIETIEIVDDCNFIVQCNKFELPSPLPNHPSRLAETKLQKPIKLWVIENGRGYKTDYQRNDPRHSLYGNQFIIEQPRKIKTINGGEETVQCVRRYIEPEKPKPPLKEFHGPNSATAAK